MRLSERILSHPILGRGLAPAARRVSSVWTKVRGAQARDRDLRAGSFETGYSCGGLSSHVSAPSAASLRSLEDGLAWVGEQYLAHRFDLLGSGWTEVRHGMSARGVEGHRFPPAAAVRADATGNWLVGRINRSNLREARAVWSLVDRNYVPIDWQLDFKSGFRWSESTWHRDVRYGDILGADVKVPWELARFQHLPQLAWCFLLAKAGRPGFRPAEAYWREFRNQVLDFIANNPPRWGVNWRTTMDVGIRVANLVVAFDLFRGLGATVDAAFSNVFERSVFEHVKHCANHLEYAPSMRSNHYLGDLCGLLFGAAYLPAGREADAWLALGVQELVSETQLQFHPDGSNFEGSTSYHRLSAEMVTYCSALVVGLPKERSDSLRRYDHRVHEGRPPLRPAPLPFHPHVDREVPLGLSHWDRVARMTDLTLAVTRPDGRIVQLGDNDSGRLFKFAPAFARTTRTELAARFEDVEPTPARDGPVFWEDGLDHTHLVAAHAGLFGEKTGAVPHPDTDVVRSLCAGVKVPAAPRGENVPSPKQGATWAGASARLVLEPGGAGLRDALVRQTSPDFGVYVFRSRRFFLCVRCGPYGQLGRGGHSHNDQLSVELWIDGRPWLVDPGTYLYTPLPSRRNEYRSASAHHGPSVRGAEPSDMSTGLFRLTDRSHAQVLRFDDEGFEGTHSGYGAPITRRIRIEDARIIIEDAGEPIDRGEQRITSPPASPTRVPFSPGYGWRERRHVP